MIPAYPAEGLMLNNKTRLCQKNLKFNLLSQDKNALKYGIRCSNKNRNQFNKTHLYFSLKKK